MSNEPCLSCADVSSHTQIRNLLTRTAYLADQGTLEEYLTCFAPDAIWELTQAEGLPIPPSTLRGQSAILESVAERRSNGVQGPGTFTAHALSTTTVTINGSTATAHSLFMFYSGINATPELVAVGRYTDTLTKDHTKTWLLQHRKITRG